jgi:hypothetical protein
MMAATSWLRSVRLSLFLVASISAHSAASTSNEPPAELRRVHAAHARAEVAGNIAAMRSRLGARDPLLRGRESQVEQYVSHVVKLRDAGVQLLRQDVRQLDMYSQPNGFVGFLRVASTYSNPIPGVGHASLEHTLIALSRDGRRWQFVPPGCSEEAIIREFLPSYAGVPPLEEEAVRR